MSIGYQQGALGGVESPPRRRPRRRLSIGHIAVAVAALLAFVANLAFLRSADDSLLVVVAARPVAAGNAIAPGDLSTARMRADASVVAGLVTSLDGLSGRIARRDLAAGELVGQADLLTGAAPDGLRSMAIPIDPAHAAGGTIRVGDRVDIIDVGADGTARYVVRQAPVLTLSEQGTGALAGSGGSHIVIGLGEAEVLEVAAAIADGDVDVVVTTGSDDG